MFLFEELVVGSEHSKEGWRALLWTERVVAILFTVEYVMRWRYSEDRARYPFSLMALIDLLAIVPFYVGFFVSDHTLHLIRTLRVLRLLKVYRRSQGLQLLARGFYKVRYELRALGFAVFVTIFASHAAIYEAERYAQPDKFGSLPDAFWFTCTTVTTVGYGDLYPVTAVGRVVAVLTFIIGITLVGTFTGVMGSAFASVLREEGERRAGQGMIQDTKEEGDQNADNNQGGRP